MGCGACISTLEWVGISTSSRWPRDSLLRLFRVLQNSFFTFSLIGRKWSWQPAQGRTNLNLERMGVSMALELGTGMTMHLHIKRFGLKGWSLHGERLLYSASGKQNKNKNKISNYFPIHCKEASYWIHISGELVLCSPAKHQTAPHWLCLQVLHFEAETIDIKHCKDKLWCDFHEKSVFAFSFQVQDQ